VKPRRALAIGRMRSREMARLWRTICAHKRSAATVLESQLSQKIAHDSHLDVSPAKRISVVIVDRLG